MSGPPPVPPNRLLEHLRGDGPCGDCGTNHDNIVWSTDNVLWNHVVGGPDSHDDPGGLLCIPCFVQRVDDAGLAPTGWRLIPDWHWETTDEREHRLERRAQMIDKGWSNPS